LNSKKKIDFLESTMTSSYTYIKEFPSNLMELETRQIREELRYRGLSTVGSKYKLSERLQSELDDEDSDYESDCESEYEDSDFDSDEEGDFDSDEEGESEGESESESEGESEGECTSARLLQCDLNVLTVKTLKTEIQNRGGTLKGLKRKSDFVDCLSTICKKKKCA
jgi:hypothetical protein